MSRLLLGAAIAACFTAGCSSTVGQVPLPSSSEVASEPGRFPIARTTFQVSYELQAETGRSTSIRFDVPEGMRIVSRRSAGDQLRQGAAVGDLEILPRVRVQLKTAAQRSTFAESRLRSLDAASGAIFTPVAGIVDFDGRIPSIIASGMDAIANLSPLQALRYMSTKFSGTASVQTTFGATTVKCAALWIDYVDSARLHCRLPNGIETAPGLPAAIYLKSAPLSGAIAIPAVYVGFDAQRESYFVTTVQGSRSSRRYVVVGPTDGVRRLITDGLAVGEVLEKPSG